jgi:hypothetical protein
MKRDLDGGAIADRCRDQTVCKLRNIRRTVCINGRCVIPRLGNVLKYRVAKARLAGPPGTDDHDVLSDLSEPDAKLVPLDVAAD